MSHRCGANCRRKRGLRSECEPCNRYKESRRKTVPAPDAPGGRVWTTIHWRKGPERHPEVSYQDAVYVLANWRIRGTCYDSKGRPGICHYAFVPDKDKVVRVVLSLDGTRLVTTFIDSSATDNWRKANMAYFAGRMENMEVRGNAFGD